MKIKAAVDSHSAKTTRFLAHSIRAEAGIGSLILFIALVLVAAAAAAIFIQTSTSLQGKALLTASNSQKAISTEVMMLSAWGENASATGNIGDIYVKLKLAPGSDAIPLNSSYMTIATAATRQVYKFNQSSGCSFTNLSAGGNSGKFLVSGMIGYAKPGYLQDGDIVNTCLRLPTNLTGDMALAVTFSIVSGAPTTISVTMPSVLTDVKTSLYP